MNKYSFKDLLSSEKNMISYICIIFQYTLGGSIRLELLENLNENLHKAAKSNCGKYTRLFTGSIETFLKKTVGS